MSGPLCLHQYISSEASSATSLIVSPYVSIACADEQAGTLNSPPISICPGTSSGYKSDRISAKQHLWLSIQHCTPVLSCITVFLSINLYKPTCHRDAQSYTMVHTLT